MQICQDHWNKMRAEIERLGLSHLVAQGGGEAASRLQAELKGAPGETTFDPLMSMHWAICGNAMETLRLASGHPPLYLLSDGPEDPVDLERAPTASRTTWPRCPLCFLNLAHEISCTNERCQLPKRTGYDWMIERAGEDAFNRAKELGLLKES